MRRLISLARLRRLLNNLQQRYRRVQRPTVLIFSPNDCFPPCHGSHHRCIQQIEGISHSCTVYVASSRFTSDVEWPLTKKDSIASAMKYGVSSIFLYEDSLLGFVEHFIAAIIRRAIPIEGTYQALSKALESMHEWLMSLWFFQLSLTLNASAVIVNYTRWTFLIRLIKKPIKILELHDILAINTYLGNEISSALIHSSSSTLHLLETWPWYIDKTEQLPTFVLNSVKHDIDLINRFDLAWMISPREKRFLEMMGMQTQCEVIYPSISYNRTLAPKCLPPILPLGPNAFNAYSLVRFIKNILPLVDTSLLRSTTILVTGSLGDLSHSFELPPPLSHIGFVDDYLGLLAKCSLMLAPTGVGTGQQVKIFEALAVGTPVLAYKASVPDDILADNPSIMAARNEDEYAQYLHNFLSDDSLQAEYVSLAAKSACFCSEVSISNPYSESLRSKLKHFKCQG